MWHCLTHATTEENLLKILESKVIKADWSELGFPINPHAFCFYLSSAIKMYKNEPWSFVMRSENNVIIGISPQILNKQNFIMCDRRSGGRCAKLKYHTVNSSKKGLDFTLINNFINKRLHMKSSDFSRSIHPVTNDLRFMNNYFKYFILNDLYQRLEFRFIYAKNTLPNNKQTRYILNKIQEVENMSDDQIVEEYTKLHYHQRYSEVYHTSHEFVIQDGIHVNYIDFILISKDASQEFKDKLYELCPSWIKIKEIDTDMFTKWSEKTEKLLDKVAEHI